MKRLLPLLLVLSCTLLTGCASRINETMESWVGHHQSDLIASWGPPQQIMDDGSGGRILIYTQNRTFTSPGTATTTTTGSAYGAGNTVYGNATSTTTYNPPRTSGYQANRMFWVNSNGRIYRWSWKGL